MPYKEMPEAVRIIKDKVNSLNTRLAMLFTIYTGVRGQETRDATWSEIDLEARTWTIPTSRMKARKPHIVPISNAALDILEQAKPLRNEAGLVFPSSLNPRNAMTSATLVKALDTIGLAEKTVVHGFRASFKTWATEQTETAWEVVEAALAHSPGNTVEKAYLRGDLFDKRRVLMQSWADYLKG